MLKENGIPIKMVFVGSGDEYEGMLEYVNKHKLDNVFIGQRISEYEIPTLKLWKYNIPISGGGYLRLFPFFIMKRLIKMYEKAHKNFLLYVHPFELTNIKLPLPDNIGFKTKFRCLVGRKHNLRKIRKIITFLKGQGADFRTLTYDRKNRLGID
jgi:hypothetical protein